VFRPAPTPLRSGLIAAGRPSPVGVGGNAAGPCSDRRLVTGTRAVGHGDTDPRARSQGDRRAVVDRSPHTPLPAQPCRAPAMIGTSVLNSFRMSAVSAPVLMNAAVAPGTRVIGSCAAPAPRYRWPSEGSESPARLAPVRDPRSAPRSRTGRASRRSAPARSASALWAAASPGGPRGQAGQDATVLGNPAKRLPDIAFWKRWAPGPKPRVLFLRLPCRKMLTPRGGHP